MKKTTDYIEVMGDRWNKTKPLSDFNILIDNLMKEGKFSRAQCFKYLIKRVEIAEKRLKEYE